MVSSHHVLPSRVLIATLALISANAAMAAYTLPLSSPIRIPLLVEQAMNLVNQFGSNSYGFIMSGTLTVNDDKTLTHLIRAVYASTIMGPCYALIEVVSGGGSVFSRFMIYDYPLSVTPDLAAQAFNLIDPNGNVWIRELAKTAMLRTPGMPALERVIEAKWSARVNSGLFYALLVCYTHPYGAFVGRLTFEKYLHGISSEIFLEPLRPSDELKKRGFKHGMRC